MNDEVYHWLTENEETFLNELKPDVSRIMNEMKMFSDVDMSDYVEGLKDIIKEFVEQSIVTTFHDLSAEEFLIVKEDNKVQQFIKRLQTIAIKGDNEHTHTLH